MVMVIVRLKSGFSFPVETKDLQAAQELVAKIRVDNFGEWLDTSGTNGKEEFHAKVECIESLVIRKPV